MFKPGAPGLAIKFFKDRDNPRGNQFALGFALGFDDIDGVNIFGVGGVKVATIVDPGRGDVVEHGLRQVAMRINDGHTPALSDVVDGHVGDEGGFTGA